MSGYEFWQAALAGKKPPVHEGDPMPGFYYKLEGDARLKKDRTRLPVAIWQSDVGDILTLVGFNGSQKLRDSVETWSWVCQYPVTEEAYRRAFDAGRWADDPPPVAEAVLVDFPVETAGIGHNLPIDPAERMAAELHGEEETTAEFLATPITTQADADKAAVWAKRLTEMSGKAVDLHKAAKAPALEAGRIVDRTWFPIRDRANELATKLKNHMLPFLKKQKEAAEAAAWAAEKNAANLRERAKEVEESATTAEAFGKAAELIKEANAEEAAAAPKRATAGRTGARVSLTTVYRAVIVDYDKAYEALKRHPDMGAFVQLLADRACTKKVPLDGVEFRAEDKAR
jgi:hypothetical protein